jgi:hypothetical protein
MSRRARVASWIGFFVFVSLGAALLLPLATLMASQELL